MTIMMAMAMPMMMLMAMTMMTNPRSSGSSREKATKSENDCSLVFLNNLEKETHVIVKIILRSIVIFVTLIVTKREIGRVATIIRMDPRVRNIAQIPGPSVHAVNKLN